MRNIQQKKPLSNQEISSFCSQIAMILQAGITPMEGISMMIEDSSSREDQEILTHLLSTYEETGSMHEALAASGLYPNYMLQMVKIGETTGKLEDVMAALSRHYEREESLSSSIKNAIAYPLIMVSIMIAVILILTVKVMPVFNQVFIQLGQEMSGLSRLMMDLGSLINRYAIAFILLLVLLALGSFAIVKTKKGRQVFQNFCYRFSFTRKIYENRSACRFSSGMALVLSSGLNPEEGLELVESLVEDVHFQKRVHQCRALTTEGEDFAQALTKSHIFTGIYARMISIAYRTGTMDDTMETISIQYQEELDVRFGRILSVLEPTIVILLSLIVGTVLLSVMLPLIGIMSNI